MFDPRIEISTGAACVILGMYFGSNHYAMPAVICFTILFIILALELIPRTVSFIATPIVIITLVAGWLIAVLWACRRIITNGISGLNAGLHRAYDEMLYDIDVAFGGIGDAVGRYGPKVLLIVFGIFIAYILITTVLEIMRNRRGY